MRLAKYLAHAGVASRRAAEEIIRAGRVQIDGEVVTDPARDADDSHHVTVDGEPIATASQQRVVYAVHKPRGVLSTAKDTHDRPVVTDLVASPQRLYPVGRLDIGTTGLILLTNDGALAFELTHPSFEVPKTYKAKVRGKPTDAALRKLREGVVLEDGLTAPARVRRVGPETLELTIHEGRKRQVRRMLEAVGHPVLQLQRIAFGPLVLGDLRPGAYRKLDEAEIAGLRH